MPYQDIVIQTAGSYREAFESDPVTRIADRLGLGDFYRKASANTMLEDPYTEIEDGFITTIGNHKSLKECLVQDTKEMYCMVKDGVRYTLKNPVDIALIPAQAMYEMIKRPKALGVIVLGLALAGSGCTSSGSDDAPTQEPTPKPIQEKVVKTTPDGLNFYEKKSDMYITGTYRGAYDTNNDGVIDVRDSAVDQAKADQLHKGSMPLTIKSFFGIPTDSKMYDQHPNIEEFRIRAHYLDDDKKADKIEIIINDKIVHTTTTDTDNDGGIDIGDAVKELGWREL